MSTTSSFQNEFVVIHGVSPDDCERIAALLGESQLRRTEDQGTLQVRRVLHGVTPQMYRQFLDTFPQQRVRLSYDGRTLEMMTPRKRQHEWVEGLLGRMIEAMALALDIPIQTTGSTTLSSGNYDRGVEPDRSYYVRSEPFVGSETYDPEKDPPPNLVIEVDVARSVVPRVPIHARIRVPELWRYRRGRVQFYRLSDSGRYVLIERSIAFPFITPDDITRFLNQRRERDENSVVRGFVKWAKEAYREHKS
ncbi:MAG: Uma2 family endonuclease [Pirellulales bacterium]|nr:Uma2 family endonuclease [Pirellulales bacterium]